MPTENSDHLGPGMPPCGESDAAHIGHALRQRFGLLNPAEFALLIGIDERTAATWRLRGAGPDYVKLGRAIFYRREDVDAWIKLNVMPCDRAA